jgi:hypothetical protein
MSETISACGDTPWRGSGTTPRSVSSPGVGSEFWCVNRTSFTLARLHHHRSSQISLVVESLRTCDFQSNFFRPRIRRWTFDVGPFALSGNPLPAGDLDFDLCPRRTVLDKALVDAASEAGAEVRENFAVQGILSMGDRVCGIQAQTADGRVIQERAHLVIGADGRRSRIARLVDASYYDARPALTFGYYSYWSDAGYHRDAITGQRITDAFRDADLLAAAVDAGLSGRQALIDALAGYEQTRNAAVLPMYEFTYKLAQLAAPSEDEQRLFGALRTNQHETERFLSIIAGSLPVQEFLDPANVQRIVSGAEAVLPVA